MCNLKYMKINIKSSIAICLVLGMLLYFLYNKKQIQAQPAPKQEPIVLVDKNPLLLPAPKLLIVAPAQNKVGIDSNWKSR